MQGALEKYLAESDAPLIFAEAKETGPAIKPPAIHSMNGVELAAMEFAPLVSPVENLIVEGLTLLCSASKTGKSWFALQLCSAIARGVPFLGRKTQSGTTLYLAYEDSVRRLKHRLYEVMREPASEYFFFDTQIITLGTGLLDALEAWTLNHPTLKLVVIDVYQKVRGESSPRANMYSVDYSDTSKLKAFADKHHVAVLLVHHMNKQQDTEDPFDRISGSSGLMGCADTIILIDRKRKDKEAKLIIEGRDVWGDDIPVRFNDETCRWETCDPAALARERYEGSPVVQAIKRYIALESLSGKWPVSFETFRVWALEQGLFVGSGNTDTHRALESIAPLLAEHDGIFIEFGKNIGGKRGMIITRKGGAIGV